MLLEMVWWIYLVEPQWNPQPEQQAFGRAQRLGQTEQVTIIRYVMNDTVEDVTQRRETLLFCDHVERK